MPKILRAEDIKPDYKELKKRWDEMLSKYFVDDETLDDKYTLKVPCPYCAGTNVERPFKLNGFIHNTCSECKTLYVSPRLSDPCIEELYSDEYYNEVYARSMLPAFEKRKELIGKSKYSQTIKHWGNEGKGSVLDIGAGIGEVTDVFLDNGWETHAIEMNEVAIDWLQERGHQEVFHGRLEDYKASKKFDIIMAWGVVEHVLEPDEFLKTAFNLLKPGGIFVSEVPHGECFLVDMTRKSGTDPERILMGEQHIVLYSTESYVCLHERNKLEKVHIQTNGLDFDTIHNVNDIEVSTDILGIMQECIDEKMYGDLLRGFWRRP